MELKQPTSYDQQIAKLRAKNIVIDDISSCKTFLSSVNYYRFSAYYLPFKIDDDHCTPGLSFCIGSCSILPKT